MPKSRIDFWQTKFQANIRRDGEVRRKLRRSGWTVITVWECELINPDRLAARLDRAVMAGGRIGRRRQTTE
jgi:DNA mismatch endonuclease (patch repair protein)